ncbi:TolC family protein [Campylobacter suis]|uniref:TolC family protein n=1 Tax=Campylobacter suis TaxID=2790657 RepID=A0ABM8Q1Z5_9BACT|nr:TolC family protein [Campylobacter suis]CAD7286781.1 hypothetical protein LMG8286_00534 [Campylobacter suis]
MRKILPIFLLVLFASGASLKDIIVAAKSAEIAKIKEFEARQAYLERDSVKSGYFPSLSLNASYSSTSGDRQLLTPKESLLASASVNFILYDGGAREARLDALKFSQNAKDLRSLETKNYLALQSVLLYFNALNLNEQINAKKAEIKHLSEAKNRLDKFKNAGLASLDESEAVSAKLSLSQSDEMALKAALANVFLQIETLCGLKDISLENFFIDETNLTNKNTEIMALNQEILATTQAQKIANSQLLPTIFIKNTFLSYKNNYDFGILSQNYRMYQGYLSKILKEDRQNANEIMLGFSWSIFDFGKTQKQSEIKKLDTIKASLNLAYKSRENELKIKSIKNDIAAIIFRIDALTSAKEASSLSLMAVMKQYEAGLAGYSEFLNAVAREFEAKSALSIAKNELEIKRANLVYENGDDIEKRVRQ